MCKTWGGIRIQIWIGIKMESQIRIGINMMPIQHWYLTWSNGLIRILIHTYSR